MKQAALLAAYFLLDLLFSSEDRSDIFLRIIRLYTSEYSLFIISAVRTENSTLPCFLSISIGSLSHFLSS
jgi:hypothetical protein